VKFIGHPLVGAVQAPIDRQAFLEENRLTPERPVVTVLPGSRAAELRQHLPVLRQACLQIQRETQAQFVVAATHGTAAALRDGWPSDLAWRVVEGRTYDALAAADAAIVSSGTATVEAALLDVPMVVVYRVTPLTALLARPLVRTPFFSMVNLIAGRRVVPELVQDDFTPDRVSAEVVRLLREPAARDTLRSGLADVRRHLGPPGAVERAADAILSVLKMPCGNAK
jgi:lipid-A-disaccharide synthase